MVSTNSDESPWGDLKAAFAVTAIGLVFFTQIPPMISLGDRWLLLFPPFVGGWLLLLLAARILAMQLPQGRDLATIALAGLVVSIPLIVVLKVTGDSRWTTKLYFGLWGGLLTAGAILSAVYVWRVCTLIAELADEAGRRDVRSASILRRYVFIYNAFVPFIAAAVSLLTRGASRISARAGTWGVYFLGAVALAMTIALMGTAMRLCEQEMRARRDEERAAVLSAARGTPPPGPAPDADEEEEPPPPSQEA